MSDRVKMNAFPPGFLIGATTAAHQVEGNNIHSDFWALEQLSHSSFKEPSLSAVDHYNRYAEDVKLLKEAGLNAYRFSIEWARIEPMEGVFDISEVEHYRDMIQTCRSLDVEPIVSLHHFSSPKWLIAKGGFEHADFVGFFVRYVAFLIKRLGSLLTYVCTINEANIGLQIAAIARDRMKSLSVQTGFQIPKEFLLAADDARIAFGVPQVQHFLSVRTERGNEYICQAHVQARNVIKTLAPHVKVGITLSLHDFQAAQGGEDAVKKVWDEEFMSYLPFLQGDDFLGVQNYTRKILGVHGAIETGTDVETTQMGYEFYPEALEHVIRKIHDAVALPIIVTENGIATDDDSRRIAYIDRALAGVGRCLEDGIPVVGYCYWSLLDNFEWRLGYVPKFGLIAVDRQTMRRFPKLSLRRLGSYSERISDDHAGH